MTNEESHISILINRMKEECPLTRFSISYEDDNFIHRHLTC